jgi:hypothetical protein
LTVFEPVTNLLPVTVSVAVALVPDAINVAVPKVTVPAVKVTLPVGAVAPPAGLIVAVMTVLPVEVMLVGLPETLVVVATTTGAVTVTVVVAVDPVKGLFPA